MERVEWLKQMRSMAEALYDRISPQYWVTFGLHKNEAHQQYLQEFLERVVPGGAVLSAGCGAGRYDGAPRDPIGAQTMQDWRLEASGGRGLRVCVQRVPVAG